MEEDSAKIVNSEVQDQDSAIARISSLEKTFNSFMEMVKPIMIKRQKRKRSDHEMSESDDDEIGNHGDRSGEGSGLADGLLAKLADQDKGSNDKSESDINTSEFAVDLSSLEAELSGGEVLGPDIMPKVASIGNKVFENPITPSQVKEIEQKFLKPSNLEKVVVPKVNPGVWNKVPRLNKASDLKYQSLQQHVVKASTAILQATDYAMKMGEKDCSVSDRKQLSADLIKGLVDATALLGRTNYELSLMRRLKLKPVLKSQYASLCSDAVPVTDLLFGDDVSKAAKDIKQTEDVCRDFESPGPAKRRSYGGSFNFNHDSKNWSSRGRGRGNFSRGRYNKFQRRPRM